MTSFYNLFKELFKQKRKSAHLILIVQLISSFVLTVITMITSSDEGINSFFFGIHLSGFINYLNMFATIFLSLSFLGAFVYLIMTSCKNEKLISSQTWRLIPISDAKFYIINTLSSFVAYIYLIILNNVIILIDFIITYLSSNELRHIIASVISKINQKGMLTQIDWFGLVEIIILLLLSGLSWYITISFYNFLSKSIDDFLPSTSNRLVLIIVRIISLIVFIYINYYIARAITATIGMLTIQLNSNSTAELSLAILVLIIFNIILGSLNILLLNKFVEAKQK